MNWDTTCVGQLKLNVFIFKKTKKHAEGNHMREDMRDNYFFSGLNATLALRQGALYAKEVLTSKTDFPDLDRI
jgi:hypothetical protein